MRAGLRKRLLYLWTLEAFNGLVWFPLIYAWLGAHFRLGWFSLAALIVVCVMLVVGAAYWFLKWRAVGRSERLTGERVRRAFRAARWLFRGMLALLGVLLAARIAQGNASLAELVAGSGLTLLAVLEYVNYFHWQISYDSPSEIRYLLRHRRLKRATLVRDLEI